MKTFLVPAGGADGDQAVFETALAAARPVAAHLNFLHVRIGAGQAALNSPHTDFATGPALGGALEELETEAKTRSITAAQHVREFCVRSKIPICEAPSSSTEVTASWREEEDDALARIMFHARHNDLIVVGR